MIGKIINHSLIYAVLPKLPILVGFFMLPVLTPHLTDIDYGIYGIVLSIVTGVTVLKSLGLEIILMNSFIHNAKSGRYVFIWNEIQGFIFLWSTILGVLVSILIYFILPKEANENRDLVVLLTVIPIVLFSSLQIISIKYYQLAEKPIEIGYRSLIFGVIAIILNYYFIAVINIGYMGWVWSFFIMETLIFVSYLYPIWIKRRLYPNFLFRRRALHRYLKISLPLVPHTSSFFLLDFSDRLVMLNLGVDTAKIGLYDFAYRFAGYARVFSESIHQASTPLLMKSYKKTQNTPFLKNMIFFQSYLVCFVSFSISLWLREIFDIMVNNEDLANTYSFGVFLTMSYAYKPMYTAMATVFYYLEKTKQFWKISLIAGLINIVLNFVFIPIYGFKVAVITTFVSFLYLGFSGFLVSDFRKYYQYNFRPLFWVLYIILLLTLSYVCRDADLFIKLILNTALLIFTLIKLTPLFKKVL